MYYDKSIRPASGPSLPSGSSAAASNRIASGGSDVLWAAYGDYDDADWEAVAAAEAEEERLAQLVKGKQRADPQ